MKTAATVIGALMMLLGTVWFFQGINVLPGSFMTGQIQWAVYGAMCWGAGIALILFLRKSGRQPPPSS